LAAIVNMHAPKRPLGDWFTSCTFDLSTAVPVIPLRANLASASISEQSEEEIRQASLTEFRSLGNFIS
jgi:hypothetical protein